MELSKRLKNSIAVVVVIKLFLIVFFTSDYQLKLFIPFIQNGLLHTGASAYNFTTDNLSVSPFPYPPVMLLVMQISGILDQIIPINQLWVQNIIYKIPLLIFDVFGLFGLFVLFPKKKRDIVILFFMSPIITYATYMHGQLDIIPIVFLIWSTVFLLVRFERIPRRSALLISAFIFALATMSKSSVLAVLPLFLIYVFKKYGWKVITAYFLVWLITCIACIVPFITPSFIQNVFLNNEQNVLFKVSISYGAVSVLVPLFALVFLYAYTYYQVFLTRNLFLVLNGVTFSIFLILITAMPGWYVWIVPYLTIFFVSNKYKRILNSTIYFILNFLYLLYFIVFFRPVNQLNPLYFLNIPVTPLVSNELAADVVFTLLIATFVFVIFLMIRQGVSQGGIQTYNTNAFVIGIGGDSGSGKTEMSKLLSKTLGDYQILHIEGDGDHKWERNEDKWSKFTHLDPSANFLYRQALDIQKLKHGSSARRVEYDHSSGTFTPHFRITPKKFIVFSGLHVFFLPKLRNEFDLRIYLDTDETLRRYWKIARDVGERGYNFERIMHQIEFRMRDAKKYIYPQKEFSNLVIRYYDDALDAQINLEQTPDVKLAVSISSEINTDTLVEIFDTYQMKYTQSFDISTDLQTFDFYDPKNSEHQFDFDVIIRQYFPNSEDFIMYLEKSDTFLEQLVQLFVIQFIQSKMLGEFND